MTLSPLPDKDLQPNYGIPGFKTKAKAADCYTMLVDRYWPRLRASIAVTFSKQERQYEVPEWVVLLYIPDDLAGDIMLANLQKEFSVESGDAVNEKPSKSL